MASSLHNDPLPPAMDPILSCPSRPAKKIRLSPHGRRLSSTGSELSIM
jgi:hypothetical protein